MKIKSIRKLDKKTLHEKIQETRASLGKMRMDSAKGTLRKDSGKIRPMKRDIARMLTVLNEEDTK